MEDQLHQAIEDRDLPTVRRILQGGGVNVNAVVNRDNYRQTFLHHAASAVHLRIVQAVLQANGVHVDARDTFGNTPLHLALRRGSNVYNEEHLQVVQALLDAGADPNAVGHGETPLSCAVYIITGGCQIRVVEALLNRGANPAARNNRLDTPLHEACYWGRPDIVELLIRRQGSECLTLKNNREETPLDLTDAFFIGEEPASSIQKHILQCYAGMIAQRRGLLCLHSVLQEATFINGNEENGSEEDGNEKDMDMDGNEYIVRLAVGKLISKNLQILLEYIIAAEPGSVRALDRDGLLPLQVASLRNFPDLALNVLLRSYPDALL